MKLFLEGMATATLAIIIAEIVFNYGVGDKVKDLFAWLKNKLVALFRKFVGKGKAEVVSIEQKVKEKI